LVPKVPVFAAGAWAIFVPAWLSVTLPALLSPDMAGAFEPVVPAFEGAIFLAHPQTNRINAVPDNIFFISLF
jgi:hypothetical protein